MTPNKRRSNGGDNEDRRMETPKRRRSELSFKNANGEQDVKKEEPCTPSWSRATSRRSSLDIKDQKIRAGSPVTPKTFGFPSTTSPELVEQVAERLSEYKKKKNRGTISHEEMKFLERPKLLLAHLKTLVGVKQKRQRLPAVTVNEKIRIHAEFCANGLPKGSVDIQKVATDTRTEHHQVKYQLAVMAKEIEERTGQRPERERQTRPRISRVQKESLNTLDHTSQVMPRGSCDRHQIAKKMGVRRDQVDHHYMKH